MPRTFDTSASRMRGELFSYHPTKPLAAFRKGDSLASTFIFIPGLTDGLLSHDYSIPLSDALNARGISFVQPVLSSSYRQYGISSLATDCEEIDQLIETLLADAERAGLAAEDVAIYLMGHSTGCQDTVYFLKHGRHAARVRRAILQAPVSDRDFFTTLPETAARAALAREMVAAGRGQELLPADVSLGAEKVPITAYRWDSFCHRLGDDDMFSNDLTAEELKGRLGHIRCPTLILFSLADEYVPATVDGRALAGRMRGALGGPSELVLVEGGTHALAGHAALVASAVPAFLARPFPAALA